MALILLKDDNPLAHIHFQYVTVALIAICVAVFFWQASLGTLDGSRVVYGLGTTPAVLLGDKKLPPELAMVPAEMTLLTSKLSGWLKTLTSLNVLPMSVTLPVSKASGWLKASASKNMAPISLTLLVSNGTGWLKAAADRNM